MFILDEKFDPHGIVGFNILHRGKLRVHAELASAIDDLRPIGLLKANGLAVLAKSEQSRPVETAPEGQIAL